MGSRDNHLARATHIGADMARNTSQPDLIPSKAWIEDLFYAASHWVDLYLAAYDVHPTDQEHRDRVLDYLAARVGDLSQPWQSYHVISDVMIEVKWGGVHSLQVIKRLSAELTVLQYWISQLTF